MGHRAQKSSSNLGGKTMFFSHGRKEKQTVKKVLAKATNGCGHEQSGRSGQQKAAWWVTSVLLASVRSGIDRNLDSSLRWGAPGRSPGEQPALS